MEVNLRKLKISDPFLGQYQQLVRDVVIPYQGVEKALGMELAHKCIDLLDFDFDYTHENPFPVNGRIDRKKVDASFEQVFSKAAEFLK